MYSSRFSRLADDQLARLHTAFTNNLVALEEQYNTLYAAFEARRDLANEARTSNRQLYPYHQKMADSMYWVLCGIRQQIAHMKRSILDVEYEQWKRTPAFTRTYIARPWGR